MQTIFNEAKTSGEKDSRNKMRARVSGAETWGGVATETVRWECKIGKIQTRGNYIKPKLSNQQKI